MSMSLKNSFGCKSQPLQIKFVTDFSLLLLPLITNFFVDRNEEKSRYGTCGEQA